MKLLQRRLKHKKNDKVSRGGFSSKHYPKDSRPSYSRLVILLFHPQVPTNLLVENRRYDAWVERYAITQNPNTPLETLQILARDANRIVRAAAKANLHSSHNLA